MGKDKEERKPSEKKLDEKAKLLRRKQHQLKITEREEYLLKSLAREYHLDIFLIQLEKLHPTLNLKEIYKPFIVKTLSKPLPLICFNNIYLTNCLAAIKELQAHARLSPFTGSFIETFILQPEFATEISIVLQQDEKHATAMNDAFLLLAENNLLTSYRINQIATHAEKNTFELWYAANQLVLLSRANALTTQTEFFVFHTLAHAVELEEICLELSKNHELSEENYIGQSSFFYLPKVMQKDLCRWAEACMDNMTLLQLVLSPTIQPIPFIPTLANELIKSLCILEKMKKDFDDRGTKLFLLYSKLIPTDLSTIQYIKTIEQNGFLMSLVTGTLLRLEEHKILGEVNLTLFFSSLLIDPQKIISINSTLMKKVTIETFNDSIKLEKTVNKNLFFTQHKHVCHSPTSSPHSSPALKRIRRVNSE